MTDIALIAQQVSVFLAPFLPYIVKAAKIGGTKAVEKLGEKVTEESIDQAKALWKKLSHKDRVKTTGEAVAKQPEDLTAQSTFQRAVAQAIQEDEELRLDMHRIISEVKVGTVLPDGKVVGVAIEAPKGIVEVNSKVRTKDVSGKVTGVTYKGE